MNTYEILLTAVLLLSNLTAFALMGADKRRAREGKYRISEKTLFTPAVLLGGLGATLGMYMFRHKTKHWYFMLFMPLLAVVGIAVSAYLYVIL